MANRSHSSVCIIYEQEMPSEIIKEYTKSKFFGVIA